MVLDFYEQRFEGIRKCEPNAAHRAIAKLEEKYNVVNMTQNIDDLLERAGCSVVHHIHGSAFKRKCEWHKNITVLDGDTNFTCDYEADQDVPVKMGDKCPKCDGQLRPSVVWFGEAVDMQYDPMAELVKEVKYNDGVFICVGTSAQVYPAAYLISFFAQVPHKYIVDLAPRAVGDYKLVEGKAGDALPWLADTLLA
jgi:NAD-dependent deacetylase